MQTQSIESISDSATAALGGPPVMPPLMVAPAAVAAAPAAATGPPLIGHPTFDPAPPVLQLRRDQVARCRSQLSGLITAIQATARDLDPILTSLQADAPAVCASELFDPSTAADFLTALLATITNVTTPPPSRAKKA